LVPEVVGAKGAFVNKVPLNSKEDWIVDIKTTIGNDGLSPKGGAGMSFMCLKTID